MTPSETHSPQSDPQVSSRFGRPPRVTNPPPVALLQALETHAKPPSPTPRAALYARVSTTRLGQDVGLQLDALQEVAQAVNFEKVIEIAEQRLIDHPGRIKVLEYGLNPVRPQQPHLEDGD